VAIVSSASALAGTSHLIQIRTSARIAVVRADALLVATPKSSHLAFLILDHCGVRCGVISACRNQIAFNYGRWHFRTSTVADLIAATYSSVT
jgi:hypothetical protein